MRLSPAPLVAMLALPLTLVAASPSGPARPIAPAAATSYPEPHPEINAAIRAIDGALEQLKLALQYDKK